MTQADLAATAGLSRRLLCDLENHRSRPDRGAILVLAECLDVPLRDRNHMLAEAGFDPEFQQRQFTDPDFTVVRQEVEALLAAHEPSPALAIDRHWTIIASNDAVHRLFVGAEPSLLRPPVNLLRLCLHPAGIAARIVNLAAWRAHLIARLRRQMEATIDPALMELLEEVRDYPVSAPHGPPAEQEEVETLAMPLRLATIDGVLTFIGTTMTFGAPADITLAEISIEAFLPGDAKTAALLRTHALPPIGH